MFLLPVAGAVALLTMLPAPQDKPRPVYFIGAVANNTVNSVSTVSTGSRRKSLTVLEAITKVKVASDADLASMVVIRISEKSLHTLMVDLRHMILTGDTKHNVRLEAGDIVFIPEKSETRTKKTRDSIRPVFMYLQGALDTKPDAATALTIHLYFSTHHPETNVRRKHVLALGAMGKAATRAVPVLVEATRQRGRVGEDAITALGMIGPAAKAAIPALETLAKHEEARLRERAKAALKSIRDKRARFLP